MTIKLNGSTAGSVSLDAPASTTSSADLTFKLPVADGTAGQVLKTDGSGVLSWVTLPITMLDQYYLNTQKSGTAGEEIFMNTNFDRVTGNITGAAVIGTGMTKSSEVFSFPSTGIYHLRFRSNVMLDSGTSANRYAENKIYVTTNNGSSYSNVSMGLDGIVSGSGERFGNPIAEFYFDVTDTSTHKCKFSVQSGNDAYKLIASSGRLDTVVNFMRIGDT